MRTRRVAGILWYHEMVLADHGFISCVDGCCAAITTKRLNHKCLIHFALSAMQWVHIKWTIVHGILFICCYAKNSIHSTAHWMADIKSHSQNCKINRLLFQRNKSLTSFFLLRLKLIIFSLVRFTHLFTYSASVSYCPHECGISPSSFDKKPVQKSPGLCA